MSTALSLVEDIREFASSESSVAALAGEIEARLRDALTLRGHASLAVSGGATPKRLYKRLSKVPLDWEYVTIVLADERWVEPGLSGSSESFIRNNLLQNHAAKARFISLKTSHVTAREAAPEVAKALKSCPLPFDAAILGMGNDGHTLSWFPGAEGLDVALDHDGPLATHVVAEPSRITGPFVERLTLTRAALNEARFIALLLRGAEKRQTWARVIGPGKIEDMPVRSLINDKEITLYVYWSP